MWRPHYSSRYVVAAATAQSLRPSGRRPAGCVILLHFVYYYLKMLRGKCICLLSLKIKDIGFVVPSAWGWHAYKIITQTQRKKRRGHDEAEAAAICSKNAAYYLVPLVHTIETPPG